MMGKSIITEIITIGDEILIGQTIDTNSTWLGENLDALGYQIIQISSIQDAPEKIVDALTLALSRSDLVVITGGLGPTLDDKTKQTLADFFNMELVLNEQVYNNISEILRVRNLPLIETIKNQAMVPDSCIVLNNSVGSAPGMLFKKDNKVVVSLPGVPFEMIKISETELFPWLKENLSSERRLFKMIMTSGLAESVLAGKLNVWESQLPDHLSLAYLPSPGIVKLRLTAEGKAEDQLAIDLDREVSKLNYIIPDAIYSYSHETLEACVGKLIRANNLTLGTAESCTGGKIASLITSVPGASTYFKGSIVAYSNEIKESLLNVDSGSIIQKGAVSRSVVVEMAENARRLMNVDYIIASSGIAGPDGGTVEKPVGLVWIAVVSSKEVISRRFHFGNHRGRNILRASLAGLFMLRQLIIKENT